jgi:hypothetical protein
MRLGLSNISQLLDVFEFQGGPLPLSLIKARIENHISYWRKEHCFAKIHVTKPTASYRSFVEVP